MTSSRGRKVVSVHFVTDSVRNFSIHPRTFKQGAQKLPLTAFPTIMSAHFVSKNFVILNTVTTSNFHWISITLPLSTRTRCAHACILRNLRFSGLPVQADLLHFATLSTIVLRIT